MIQKHLSHKDCIWNKKKRQNESKKKSFEKETRKNKVKLVVQNLMICELGENESHTEIHIADRIHSNLTSFRSQN